MIIRVQSSEGTRRVEVATTDSSKNLYEKVHREFCLSSFNFGLFRNRGKKDEIVSSHAKTMRSLKLNHGDMVFLHAHNGTLNVESSAGSSHKVKSVEPAGIKGGGQPKSQTQPQTQSVIQQSGSSLASSIKSQVLEDHIDQLLDKEDGRIQRKRNPQFCRHGSYSKCVHCSALDPWDEGYLRELKVKHMSFHAYLRKLTSGVDKGKFVLLESLSCTIKPGCREHPPWPKGICSKCQPSAVTLNRQPYRHVDNVMFENAALVERFINYWRVTGHQRIGLLYGRYSPHLDVPLGLKAEVAAIYEPPQEASRDHVKLLHDENRVLVDQIAGELGLTCVGWIFTDLVPLDANSGTVRYLRHADSHFLSAHEVITAAHLQNLHPNPCKLSPEGFFGSKFVTVIVTGDKNNQVHMEGYQVSNQCQALVKDKCLIPTKDAPELAYVPEVSTQQYVPDVYFREKDQYGNEVVRLGRPLPVEYLLLDVPVSTPNEPLHTFAIKDKQFPVENRLVEGHLQDFNVLASYLQGFREDQFLQAMSDFHLLLFLAHMDVVPLKEHMGGLLEAVKQQDADAISKWRKSQHWATVEQLVAVSSSSEGGGGGGGGGSSHGVGVSGVSSSANNATASSEATSNTAASSGSGSSWTCQHCTFINQTACENCEICHLPQ